MSTMHAPVHPGEFIADTYLEEMGISGRQLADALGVASSTVSRLLRGDSSVTGEVALRLVKALDTTPELWTNMQKNHDLWVARQNVDIASVRQIWWKAPQNGDAGSVAL